MEATRVRLGPIVEWAIAAGFVVVMVAAGSIVLREFRMISAATPLVAREAQAAVPLPPAGIAARAVSVPVLLLPGGTELRVGQRLSAIDRLLAADLEAQPRSVERAPNGERVTRYYDRDGSRFALVLEPFEPDAEPRVAAIYLQ